MNEQTDRENNEGNRAAIASEPKQRKSTAPSVSKFIVVLGGIVAILLVIVNNSVTVDRLVGEISSLDSTYKKLQFSGDSLQAEMKKLSSAERITRIGSERLGLVYSSQTLDVIAIDKDKLDDAEKRDARDTTR